MRIRNQIQRQADCHQSTAEVVADKASELGARRVAGRRCVLVAGGHFRHESDKTSNRRKALVSRGARSVVVRVTCFPPHGYPTTARYAYKPDMSDGGFHNVFLTTSVTTVALINSEAETRQLTASFHVPEVAEVTLEARTVDRRWTRLEFIPPIDERRPL